MKTKTQAKKDKRNYIIVALIVILLLLAVGYASFAQTLTISGTVNGSAKWDVHFVEGECGILDDKNNVIEGSAILSDEHTLQIDLKNGNKLDYPGDKKIVRAVIENGGTLPAAISQFTPIAPEESTGITFSYETLDGDIIYPGEKCTYDFVIGWDEKSNQASITGNYSFTFEYEQYTETKSLEASHGDHVKD